MWTCKRLFLVVEALVCHQIGMTDVSLATLWTPMRLGAPVDVQVAREIAALNEALAANVAAEALVFLLLLLSQRGTTLLLVNYLKRTSQQTFDGREWIFLWRV